MKKIKLILLSVGMALSASSFSASDWTNVVDIYTPVSGQPYVKFSANALPGCYGDAGAYLPITSSGGELVHATLLSAVIAQRQVRVYFKLNDVASGYNGWGLCTIEAVSVK